MIRKTSISVILLLSVLASGFVFAQDTLRLVIVSPRVGETIDRPERDHFRLFSQVDGFVSATFFQTPGGRFLANMKSQKAGSPEVTTIIHYSEHLLMQLSERIDQFEALQENTYQLGSEPATIHIEGVGTVRGSSLPAKMDSTLDSRAVFVRTSPGTTDELPLSPAPWPDRIAPRYPRAGFSVGFRGGYSPTFTTREAQNLNRFFGGGGSGFTAEILLEFSRVFSVALDGGNLSGGSAIIRTVAGSIRFRGPNLGRIVPYAALGISRVRIRGDDTNQNIVIEAGDAGSLFEIGLEISNTFGASVSFYYRRLIHDTVTGEYRTLQRGTIPVQLDLNGGVIGVRASIFY